jgi:chromosome segregation ATPase
MRNFIIGCIVVLLLAVGFLLLYAGLDLPALARMFTALPLVHQVTLAVAALALVLLFGAVTLQTDRMARQRRAIAVLTAKLEGVGQSAQASDREQGGLDSVLQRLIGSDPEELIATLTKRLADAEQGTLIQHSHNEAIDLESRADDIRRRQQALRGRIGEVTEKRRLIEPIFAELKERQGIIERSLQDFEKGEGGKSLETHLAELTAFLRRTEERLLAFDQGLVTLDRIKTEIGGLDGRVAPLQSPESGIKHVIQEVSTMSGRLAGLVDRLEQDGDRTVPQRVQELTDQTRELEQRIASLFDHFGTLETIRTDIGVLFTRLNVALATHAAARGADGQESAQRGAASREARVSMDTLPPHQGGSAEIRHLSSAQN